MTSGQEMERVYSCNPGASAGLCLPYLDTVGWATGCWVFDWSCRVLVITVPPPSSVAAAKSRI